MSGKPREYIQSPKKPLSRGRGRYAERVADEAGLASSAATISFLLALFFGLFAIGSLLTDLSWLISVTYESVRAGQSVEEPNARAEVNRITRMFKDEQNIRLANFSLTQNYIDKDAGGGVMVPLVEIQLSGNINMASGVLSKAGVNIRVVGPHWGTNFELDNPGSYETFDGPYDCAGTRGTASSAPCS